MNCSINSSKFLPIIDKLYQINRAKYNNYDAVSGVILKLSMSDQDKAIAIYKIAQIFSDISVEFKGSFLKGKADDVLRFGSPVDPKVFLDKVMDLFKVDVTGTEITKDSIRRKIDRLSDLSLITADRIFDLAFEMKSLATTKFESDQTRFETIEFLLERLRDVVRLKGGPMKEGLLDDINSQHDSILRYSDYVPFSETSDRLDNLIITLKNPNDPSDFKRVEGVYVNEQYVSLQGEVLKENLIVQIRPAIPKVDDTHSALHVFSASAILSGLRFHVADDQVGDTGDVTQLLTNSSQQEIADKVEIFALRNSDLGDQRVNRAREDATARGETVNRTRETFENQKQRDKLKNATSLTEVLTVSRDLSSDPFTIVGNVKGENALFSVYSFSNLTLVDNHNNTTKFDFANPEHVAKLRDLAAKYNSDGNSLLAQTDIDNLLSAYSYYQLFSKEVNKALQESPRVDITKIFLKYYDLNTIAGIKNGQRGPEIEMTEYLQNDPHMYTVVTTRKDGNNKDVVDESMTRQLSIPFVLQKKSKGNVVAELKDYKTFAENSLWDVMNIGLAENEYVLYEGEYLKLNKLFDKVIDRDKAYKLSTQIINGKHILLSHSEGKTHGYDPITVKSEDRSVRFASAISELLTKAQGLDEKGQAELLKFFKEKWYLSGANRKKGSDLIDMFHVTLGIVDNNGETALQLKVYNKDSRLDFLNDFNVTFSQDFFKNTKNFAQDFPRVIAERFGALLDAHPTIKEEFTTASGFWPNLIVADITPETIKTPNPIYRLKLGGSAWEMSDFTTNAVKNNVLYVARHVNTQAKPVQTSTPTAETVVIETEVEEEPVGEIMFSLREDSGTYADYTSERIDSEKEWLSKMLPQFKLSEVDVQELLGKLNVDGTVLGFIENTVIHLNRSLAKEGTIYHEAFHGVFGNILSKTDQQFYSDKIIGNKKYASQFTDDAIEQFASNRKLLLSRVELKNRIAEEILAEGFRSFMMNKEKGGVFTKLYQMLKKLIALFRNSPTRLYDRIQSGYYKGSALHSENRDRAYELLQTRQMLYDNPEGLTPAIQYLSVRDQTELTYNIVNRMLEGSNVELEGISLTPREKFDIVTDELAHSVYDINSLLEKTSSSLSKKDFTERATSKYGRTYENINVILTAYNGKEQLYDNATGHKITNKIPESNRIEIKKSNDLLFEQVQNILKHLKVEKKIVSKEGFLEDDMTEENEDERPQAMEGGKEGFTDTFINVNPIDSIPYEMRRFLSVIKFEQFDPELGITVPHMVDGNNVFNILLKATANCTPDEILSFKDRKVHSVILNIANEQELNGHKNDADMLRAVFRTLQDAMTAVTPEGKIVEGNNDNNILRKQFISTFHNAEVELLRAQGSIKSSMQDGDEDTKTLSVTPIVSERLTKTDIEVRMAGFESSINNVIAELVDPKKRKAFEGTLAELHGYHKTISGSSSENPITGRLQMQEKATLDTLVNNLFEKYEKLGVKLSRSLIRFSLLAIDRTENGATTDEGVYADLDMYNSMITNQQFLPKTFFTNLNLVLEQLAKGVEWNELFAYNEKGSENTPADIVKISLNKAMVFEVKVDPSEAPSMVVNAEGKPIYRYTKYSPLVMMIQEFNADLKGALESGTLNSDFLNSWYAKNPVIAAALSTTTTEAEIANIDNRGTVTEKMQMKLFIENMQLYVNGGLLIMEDGSRRSSDEFSSLSPKQLYLQQVYLFANRKISSKTMSLDILNEDGSPKLNEFNEQVRHRVQTEVTTFARNMSQQEGSNTNFLIDSYYKRYDRNQQGIRHQRAVNKLQYSVRQEFERIREEWKRKERLLQEYNDGTSNLLVMGFNGSKDEATGIVSVGDPTLRAYNFHVLRTLFQTGFKEKDTDPDIKLFRENLLAIAKGEEVGPNGEELSFMQAKKQLGLEKFLSDFLEKDFNQHIQNLIKYDLAWYSGTDNSGKRVLSTKGEMNIQKIKHGIKKYNIVGTAEEISKGTALYASIEDFLYDEYINTYFNNLMVNQLFDGDEAMGIKNEVDYYKRQKRNLAAGEHMQRMVNYSVMDTAYIYTDPNDILSGQYDTLEELVAYYGTQEDYDKVFLGREKFNKVKVFDGQSVAELFHRMDLEDDLGKLNGRSRDIMIAAKYRSLTNKEIRTLEASHIVINSLKTVVASKENYIKMSEHTYLRSDASLLINPETGQYATEAEREVYYKELHSIYSAIYALRQGMKQFEDNGKITVVGANRMKVEQEIKTLYAQTHTYWMAQKGRELHHSLINSMEYHNTDMLSDPESSKTVTFMSTSLKDTTDGYVNLHRSQKLIDGRYKYMQVVTSGMHDEAKSSVQAKMLLASDIKEMMINMKESVYKETNDKAKNTVKAVTKIFSRRDVENDNKNIYIFTDNAGRTSGSNKILNSDYTVKYNLDARYPTQSQAVIRGLKNAFPITTMVDDHRTQWNDSMFDRYKGIIDTEIDDIKQEMALHIGGDKILKFSGSKPFGNGTYSNMKMVAPKSWAYLNEKLLEIGINNTGDKPVSISTINNIKDAAISDDLLKEKEKNMALRIASINQAFTEFKDTLSKGAKVRNEELMHTFRDEKGNLDLGKLMESVGKQLSDRGTDSATLKYFEIDPVTGEPKFDVDNPSIRKMFQAKFFAHYSKLVFDEHVKGDKYIHASSYGYKVIFNKETKEIVPRYIYNQNPGLYDGEGYGTRYPGVTVEKKMVDGVEVKNYFTEIILPMPMFSSDSERELYMEKQRYLFATRIPTEDKRSMFAGKIVDWMDAAYRNSVVGPQLVHQLAGSDMDIDSIYSHEFASYKDIFGEGHIFGDYSVYDEMRIYDKTTQRYLEYLYAHASRNSSDIRTRILTLTEKLTSDPQSLQNNYVDAILNEYRIDSYQKLLGRVYEKRSLAEEVDRFALIQKKTFDSYLTLRESNDMMEEEGDTDLADWDSQRILSKELRNIKQIVDKKRERFEQFDISYIHSYIKLHAILEDLTEKGLTATLSQFTEMPSVPQQVYQNQNLQSRLDILSNEDIFNTIYKNERTDSKVWENIAEKIVGESPESIGQKSDRHTTDGIVAYNENASSGSVGIGFAATAIKINAIGNTYMLKLNPQNTIWKINILGDKTYTFDRLGQVIIDGGKHSAVTGAVGMLADTAKEPIPAVLKMNEVNTGVVLSMVTTGMWEEMAIAFNFIPEISDAVQNVINAGKKDGNYTLRFDEAVRKMLYVDYKDIDGRRQTLNEVTLKELAPLVTGKNKNEYDKEKYIIEYKTPGLMDKGRRESNTLTVADIGYKITFADGRIMTNEAQKVVLIRNYMKQIKLSTALLDLNRMIGMLKSLKPDYAGLDKLSEAMRKLANNESVFTNSKQIFSDTNEDGEKVTPSVFYELRKTVWDMLEQSEKIHFSRQKSFTLLKSLFGNSMSDKEVFTDILLQHFVMKKLRNKLNNDETESLEVYGIRYTEAVSKLDKIKSEISLLEKSGLLSHADTVHLGNLKGQLPHTKKEITRVKKDLNMEKQRSVLAEMFTGDFWFNQPDPTTSTLKEDYNFLSRNYPTNAFVQSIALVSKTDKNVPYQVLQLNTKNKYDNILKERTIDGFMELLKNHDAQTRLIALKLAMHELVRNGFSPKAGSFMKFINPDVFNGLSTKYLNQNQATKDLKKSIKSPELLKEFLKDGMTTKEVMWKMWQKLANEIPKHNLYRENKVFKNIKLDTEEDKNAALLIFHQGAITKDIKGLTEKNYVKVNEKGNTINFDVTSKDINVESASFILNNFGIRNSSEAGKFVFPSLITTSTGKLFMLTHLSNTQPDYVLKGLTAISAMLSDEEYNNKGCASVAAKYSEMTPQSANGLSLVSFSEEETDKFMELSTGDGKKTTKIVKTRQVNPGANIAWEKANQINKIGCN